MCVLNTTTQNSHLEGEISTDSLRETTVSPFEYTSIHKTFNALQENTFLKAESHAYPKMLMIILVIYVILSNKMF